jgi:hypothetical protein
MRLVQNEHRPGPERREVVAQTAHVGFFGQDAVRNDESRAYAPRVGREPARPSRFQQVLPIDDGEVEAEFLRKLVLPLKQHRGRRGDDDHFDTTPQEQFPNDSTGFDSLAEATSSAISRLTRGNSRALDSGRS